MKKNRLFIVLACLNCAHTTHAVERLDQFNPQEKKELESITKSILSDTREKGLTPEEMERVSQALDQLNKPNLSLHAVKNALRDFPVKAYPLLLQHTKNSELDDIKMIYTVARVNDKLNRMERHIAKLKHNHKCLSQRIAKTNDTLKNIKNDSSDRLGPDLARIRQKNIELLENDLQAFNIENLENMRNVLKEKNEEFLQLGQAEGSDRLDAEMNKLRIDERIIDMQEKLKTLHDNIAVVQRGGNIIPEEHNL